MKRSKFSLSYYKLLTCDMGELVPIGLTEVLAGDSIQQATSLLVRVSPLVAPVMHPVHVRVHHWFVPFRLIWDDWEKFITGGPDGMDASVFPTCTGVWDPGTPGDYLGLSQQSGEVSVLPFRAYNMIFNEHYRDQDLVNERTTVTTSGPDTTTVKSPLAKIAWEKDRFTSARPWTQKGPEVTLPMGSSAPVISNNVNPSFLPVGGTSTQLKVFKDPDVQEATLGGGAFPANGAPSVGVTWNQTGMVADLSNATPVGINLLREAFALQRYEEARARYGSRYTEYLRYLGVKSSDARLQRPEYLGGGKQTIQFSEVLQTGPDTDDSGVANLKGHGIGAMRSNRYRRFFEEHGYVMSLLSVKPKTMYAQATDKHWLRRTKEDFWQKELQHIGQAEILNREVYAGHSQPDGVFGYQDRYDEYRRQESGIAGDFRTTLDHWHYARIFASDVTLNASFVQCDATKRPNAVQTEDVLWVMANHSIQARRMVARTGTSFIF